MKTTLTAIGIISMALGCASPQAAPTVQTVSDADVKAASVREVARPLKEVMQRAVGVAVEKGFEVTTLNESLGFLTAVKTTPIQFTNPAMRYNAAYQGAAGRSVVTLRFEASGTGTRVVISERSELINFAMGSLGESNEAQVRLYADWLNRIAN